MVPYFSLSTSDGQMQGKSFVEQSSSENKSAVADSAISAAFRAWTKGSRSDLENAAVRTFVRVYRFSAPFHVSCVDTHPSAKVSRHLP